MAQPFLVSFPGGQRVDVAHGNKTMVTDQPALAGDGDAPSPFEMFLASLAACAGFYVLSFLHQRDISTEGVSLAMETKRAGHGTLESVDMVINLPNDFPDKYKDAVVKAAASCLVKKTMEDPPSFDIRVS